MTDRVSLVEIPSIPDMEVEPIGANGDMPHAATLQDVTDAYRKWQHFPDTTPLHVVLAAVLANRMQEGDPLWLMILGGSSRGKTELLAALSSLEFVRVVGSLTEASLLSGTPKRERSKNASGGLLRELPEDGSMLVVKDFGAVIAMPRDRRAAVLQALRDIYDGRYTRDVGTGGGQRLEWQGRLGFIGAATGSLDAHHSIITALGERWITLRLHSTGSKESAVAALVHHSTKQMRQELEDVVARYILNMPPPELLQLSEEQVEFLSSLSMLAANARSPVERDSYNREIIVVPQTEGPPRLARQFHKLMSCLDAMGLHAEIIAAALLRITLDTIPSPRREALEYLVGMDGEQAKTSIIATDLELPTSTALRTLEDLHVLGLAEREKEGENDNAPWLWNTSSQAASLWENASKPHRPPEPLPF